MAAFIFSSPMPIIAALEAAFPSQQDAHVRKRNSFVAAYGNMAGFDARMTQLAAIRAAQVEKALTDPATAAYLARITKAHSDWAKGN